MNWRRKTVNSSRAALRCSLLLFNQQTPRSHSLADPASPLSAEQDMMSWMKAVTEADYECLRVAVEDLHARVQAIEKQQAVGKANDATFETLRLLELTDEEVDVPAIPEPYQAHGSDASASLQVSEDAAVPPATAASVLPLQPPEEMAPVRRRSSAAAALMAARDRAADRATEDKHVRSRSPNPFRDILNGKPPPRPRSNSNLAVPNSRDEGHHDGGGGSSDGDSSSTPVPPPRMNRARSVSSSNLPSPSQTFAASGNDDSGTRKAPSSLVPPSDAPPAPPVRRAREESRAVSSGGADA